MTARVTATAVCMAAAILSAACADNGGNRKSNSVQPDMTLDVVVGGTVVDQANNPLADVAITIVGQAAVTATSDASGRFIAPAMTVRAGDAVLCAATKANYTSSSQSTKPTSSTLQMKFVLTAVTPLPIDGSLTATLYPGDPHNYVGEPYESDYAWNMRTFPFSTGAEGLSVELNWDPVGNGALKMWALEGARTSQEFDGRQVITLPPNTNAVLLVGQRGAQLTQPVNFTLTTHRVGG
jgi:hypothetical protein